MLEKFIPTFDDPSYTDQVFNPNKIWYLYVLRLENNLFYIGITIYPKARITDHFQGNGANFTKRNLPLEVVELYSLNMTDRKLCYKKEIMKTREYRSLYGKDKVIGGKFFRLGV